MYLISSSYLLLLH